MIYYVYKLCSIDISLRFFSFLGILAACRFLVYPAVDHYVTSAFAPLLQYLYMDFALSY